MGEDDFKELSLDDLSIEPVDGEKPVSGKAVFDVGEEPPEKKPEETKSPFHAETRGKKERRSGHDRRQSVRMTADRRQKRDRRSAVNPWDDTHSSN